MILVDSNTIIDVLTRDMKWYDWSAAKLAELTEYHELIIHDAIYTEASMGFEKIQENEEVTSGNFFKIQSILKEALLLAGKAFLKCKSRNGTKTPTLPDFFIGAHAACCNL